MKVCLWVKHKRFGVYFRKDAQHTLQSPKSVSVAAKVEEWTKLPAPTGLTVKQTAAKSLTISWKAVAGATQYNVYRYNSAKSSYVYIGTSYTTSYTDTGLTEGVTYYYKVVAVLKDGTKTVVSDLSVAVHLNVLAVPAVPQMVTVRAAGTKRLLLTWEEVDRATQYNVYRYNGTKKAYVYYGTAYDTYFEDTSVTAGTTYYYKVVSVYKDGSHTLVSGLSSAANAKAK